LHYIFRMSELSEPTVVYRDDSIEELGVDTAEPKFLTLKDIPIENWLTFIDKGKLDGPPQNASKIAQDLGTNDRWIHRMVHEFGFESEVQKTDDVEIAMYPPYAVAILKEEYAWRQYFKSLPTPLNVWQMTEAIGRSRGWTEKALIALDIKPSQMQRKGNRVVRLYPKLALKELRLINMAVPLDDGWYSIGQLVEQTQIDRDRLLRILRDAGIPSQERRSSLTGKVLQHFPPSVLTLLIEEKEKIIPAGGDWLTSFTIKEVLGRSGNWVNGKLQAYDTKSQLRLDDNNVPRLHYPPIVLEELRQLSEFQEEAPERGEYLNLNALARATNHSGAWVQQRLNELGIEPEIRKDKLGRTYDYYNPELIAIIGLSDQDLQIKLNKLRNRMMTAVFAYGSLYSQIKAKKAMLKTLRTYNPEETKEQSEVLRSELLLLRNSFKNAKQNMVRARSKYEESVPPKEPKVIVIDEI